MTDPLANFRRQPGGDAGKKSPEGKEPYLAMKAVDRRQFRVSIRPNVAPWVRPSYGFLQYIVEDAGRGRRFDLVFGFMVVVVRGRNLQEVIAAIDGEMCDWIQQFNPARHSPAADDGKPFIEFIEVHVDHERRSKALDQDGRTRQLEES